MNDKAIYATLRYGSRFNTLLSVIRKNNVDKPRLTHTALSGISLVLISCIEKYVSIVNKYGILNHSIKVYKSLLNIEHRKPFNLKTCSRNIKALIKRVTPILDNGYSLYYFTNENVKYVVIARGPPEIKRRLVYRYDKLSGLKHKLMEASFIHNGVNVVEIKWHSTFYKVILHNTVYNIIIVIDREG